MTRRLIPSSVLTRTLFRAMRFILLHVCIANQLWVYVVCLWGGIHSTHECISTYWWKHPHPTHIRTLPNSPSCNVTVCVHAHTPQHTRPNSPSCNVTVCVHAHTPHIQYPIHQAVTVWASHSGRVGESCGGNPRNGVGSAAETTTWCKVNLRQSIAWYSILCMESLLEHPEEYRGLLISTQHQDWKSKRIACFQPSI